MYIKTKEGQPQWLTLLGFPRKLGKVRWWFRPLTQRSSLLRAVQDSNLRCLLRTRLAIEVTLPIATDNFLKREPKKMRSV